MTNSTKNLETACTLNSNDYAARRKMMRVEIAPYIVNVERLRNGVRYFFADNSISRDTVGEFAALERQCCGFLNFTLSEPGDALTLKAEGPADAQSIYDELANGTWAND